MVSLFNVRISVLNITLRAWQAAFCDSDHCTAKLADYFYTGYQLKHNFSREIKKNNDRAELKIGQIQKIQNFLKIRTEKFLFTNIISRYNIFLFPFQEGKQFGGNRCDVIYTYIH